VDETYIRVKGKWVYLYRAVDSTGATVDFLLSAKRDAAAAERFLAKALGGETHPAPRVINTDDHAGYPSAIVRLKAKDTLWRSIAGIDRCSTSIIFWNRITGPSNAGCAPANIFAHSGEPGARSPAMKRFI
jgi:transposase-like protein